jgi:hypothetical protein
MGCYHDVVVIVFIVAIKIVAITVVVAFVVAITVVVAVTVGSYCLDRVAGEGVREFHGALQEK